MRLTRRTHQWKNETFDHEYIQYIEGVIARTLQDRLHETDEDTVTDNVGSIMDVVVAVRLIERKCPGCGQSVSYCECDLEDS